MPRPKKDGAPAAAPNKRPLTDLFVKKLKPQPSALLVWDTHQRGLVVNVQATGFRAFKVIYSFQGRPRWLTLGACDAIGLADARKLAARVMLQVAEGKDPAAEKRAQRSKGTFEEVATRYVEECARKKNKSWPQAAKLVRKHLLPKWGKLQADSISRSDVKQMVARIEAPIVANQTLAAASAIFTWAMQEDILKLNPCSKVARNDTKSRERVLAASELPQFWAAFDTAGFVRSAALKTLLLTGQRPGEVACMHRAHIKDGWWTMPGAAVPELGWPGTKNGASHRVWLPAPVQAVIAEMEGDGFVFAGGRDKLDTAMRTICTKLGAERATPHDLRRTHGSTITALGFGRDAMNRIQNHREGGISSVYDRHQYADENKRIMETVAARIMALAEGKAEADNVIAAQFGQAR